MRAEVLLLMRLIWTSGALFYPGYCKSTIQVQPLKATWPNISCLPWLAKGTCVKCSYFTPEIPVISKAGNWLIPPIAHMQRTSVHRSTP